MIAAVLNATETKGAMARLADVPKWAWWLLALTIIVVKSWCVSGNGVYGNLGDPDDATRLIQVRELLASGHWFDTTTMKIGGNAGMLSHWSRLIDLPLATIIAAFSFVVSQENAERIAHVVWPTVLLAATLWIAFRTTVKMAGDRAGLIVLVLAVMCPFALYQFSVGRIDHHNAMIAASVSAALLIWANPQDRAMWRISGILLGLALAVGYEALAPAVAIGIFVTLWGLIDAREAEPAINFAIAIAATFTLAFVATTAPARWIDIHCDAISLNMVVLVAFGIAGVVVALGRGRNWPMPYRLAAIAAATAVGIAAYGVLEPQCLAGPKGQLPPLLSKVWLDNVAENDSILRELIVRDFELAFGLFVFFAIALTAQFGAVRKSRAPADVFLLAALSAFTAFACWQYKYMGYASFLAIVPIAITASRLEGLAGISTGTVRFGAIVLSSQAFLLAASGGLNDLVGTTKVITEGMRADAGACSQRESLRDIADLPPGLVASHIDVGAYIAALTPHRALSAPYHRIANAIIANHQIFSAHDPADAAAVLKREQVDYVVTCRGLDAPFSDRPEAKGTLRSQLVHGEAPKFLVPVTLSNANSMFRVWKVDRAALNLPPSAASASKP